MHNDGITRTKLELASPHSLGRVLDERFGKVTLHATDHVVTVGLGTLADNAKGVVLHDGGAADPAKKTLLHSALEAEDGDLW